MHSFLFCARPGLLGTGLVIAILLQLFPFAAAQWPGGNHAIHGPRRPPAVCSIVRFCPDVSILGAWKPKQKYQQTPSSCTTLYTATCTFYTVCNLTATPTPTDTCTESTTSTTASCNTSSTSSTASCTDWSSPTPASYSYGRKLTPIFSPFSPSPITTPCSSSTTSCSTESEIDSWPPSFATDSTTLWQYRTRTRLHSIQSFHTIVTPTVPRYPSSTTTSDDCEKTKPTPVTEE